MVENRASSSPRKARVVVGEDIEFFLSDRCKDLRGDIGWVKLSSCASTVG
jgi:hypothetical protein